MQAAMKIVLGEPPQLSKYLKWSPELRAFIEDCLVKEPEKRISADKILAKHQAFFSKSRDINYVKEKLLKDLKPHEERVDQNMKEHG
jgi:serine/threonine protein kinase